jgi:hypothetical protein
VIEAVVVEEEEEEARVQPTEPGLPLECYKRRARVEARKSGAFVKKSSPAQRLGDVGSRAVGRLLGWLGSAGRRGSFLSPADTQSSVSLVRVECESNGPLLCPFSTDPPAISRLGLIESLINGGGGVTPTLPVAL